MGLTNFTHGISSFGHPVLGGGDELSTGDAYFVSSTAAGSSDGNTGTSPDKSMATIDAAMARTTANQGDIIYVMPGHVESTLTTAIAMDVAGVWVRGLGWGADRPTLTMTGTAGGITMSAASCRLSGIRMIPGVAACVAAVTMTGNDLIVENCETLPDATSEFVSLISMGVTTVGSDRSIIRNNVLKCLLTGASSTSGILMTGSNDIQIVGNHIAGFFSEHVIDNTTAASVDECLGALISQNYLQQVGSGTDLVVEMDANATGLIIGNMMSGTQALDANFTEGNMRAVDNWMVDADDVRAVGIPVATAA